MRLNPQVEFAEPNFLINHDQLKPVPSVSGVGPALPASGDPFNIPAVALLWGYSAWLNVSDLHGWDYITDTGVIKDEQGHGTSIAGIIAAQGNNATGISGVMWSASLMSLRVLDNTGTGDVANAVEAIDYAVAHSAHVINLSWGTSEESVALKDAIQRALRRGAIVICSAGNGGLDIDNTPYYPASFDLNDLIAVASSGNMDQLTSWSNYGRKHLALVAPGVNIASLLRSRSESSTRRTGSACLKENSALRGSWFLLVLPVGIDYGPAGRTKPLIFGSSLPIRGISMSPGRGDNTVTFRDLCLRSQIPESRQNCKSPGAAEDRFGADCQP